MTARTRRSSSSLKAAEDAGPRKLRLGLCCLFVGEPIKFRTTTATHLMRLPLQERRAKLSALCLANAESLLAALSYCAANGIGSFRVVSSILPIKTHPTAGYAVADLPDAAAIVAAFERCGGLARERQIRTAFHPDQFVVLNSPRAEVVAKSLEEVEYQAEVAEWIGADVINIHGGGAYGDKKQALADFERNVDRLSDRARSRLTLENDDKVYTPADLLPVCRSAGIPLVYDVHHHRCLRDELTIEAATQAALATWNREPLFHVSSPLEGWEGPRPERHHDYIDAADFPDYWRNLHLTVEVEAKAKELAVLQLARELSIGAIQD
jgi:UV DNA damage endonuclease